MQTGGDRASKTLALHRRIYDSAPDAQCVIHTHSTHLVALTLAGVWSADDIVPPITPYFVMKVGHVPLIPYHRPGDPALGDAIRGLARKHCAVLLANHGPVVSGTSLEAAVYATEELEETAKLFLLLRNTPTSPLNAEQIEELKSVFKLDI